MTAQFITRLYAFGSNGCGQLGVGHLEDLSVPQCCLFETAESLDGEVPVETQLRNDSITRIAAGGNHTLVLTGTNTVYATGNNNGCRCGTRYPNDLISRFVPLHELGGMNITGIAATWEASIFVKNRRNILVIGSGSKGELGLGEGVVTTDQVKQVFDVANTDDVHGDTYIISISASMGHVVVLLANGDVYGWGSCRKGQLGEEMNPLKISWTPRKMRVPFRATSVVTGRDFTFITGENGESLLLGDHKHFATTPDQLLLKSSNVVSGWSSLVCINGKCPVGFGRNDRGQLPPERVGNVRKLALGSEHGLAHTNDDIVLAWGWGEHGNCGLPLDEQGNVAQRANAIALTLNKEEQVDGLGAGCASSFVWTKEQK